MEGYGFPYWLLLICITFVICVISRYLFLYKRSNNRNKFLEEMKSDLRGVHEAFKERFMEECTNEVLEKLSPNETNHFRVLRLRQEAVNELIEANRHVSQGDEMELDEIERHVQETYPFPSETYAQIEPAELEKQVKSTIAEVFKKASE